jgi:hypothetical protein
MALRATGLHSQLRDVKLVGVDRVVSVPVFHALEVAVGVQRAIVQLGAEGGESANAIRCRPRLAAPGAAQRALVEVLLLALKVGVG